MAPTKNPNATPSNSGSADSNDGVATGGEGGGSKKQTGTVPKATAPVLRMERDTSQLNTKVATANYVAISSSSGKASKSTTKRSAATLIQQQPLQQQQHQQQSLTNSIFASERASPLSIVTATQHHHHHQQQAQQQQLHQRKNTEIVAPIRRDLKDLNDYLLSTVVTTANNNNNSNNQQQLHAPQQHQLKQHNYAKSQQQQHHLQHQQQQQQLNDINSTNSSGFDIETITDNQARFCYPVRPIPRRNLQQNDTNDFNSSYTSNSTGSNLNQLNTSAAVGVVIPTTPGILNNNNNSINSINPFAAATTNEDIATIIQSTNNFLPTSLRTSGVNSNSTINQQQLLLLQQLQQQIEEQQSSLLATNKQQTAVHLLDLATSTTNDINLLQRLQLIQQILSLNSKTNPGATVASANLTPQLRTQNSKMVNEVNSPTATDRDIIVNSDSLEDVAYSEMSDNRAQSIQSLHSVIETPTPDNAPTYDELQQRLEASNRNIQNMQEQQQQLIRLQNQAKQHLSEMEALRQQTAPLSFGQQNGNSINGSDAPEYQSIEQVHSDMASLVGRMKNLTTFIQNQNELGNLLGDDGPDILAEQEILQRKLESLRVQRDEMRNLVGELQDINRTAEKSAAERIQQSIEDKEEDTKRNNYSPASAATPPVSSTAAARVVPVEYSRIVPIEMLQAEGRGKQHDVVAISPQNIVDDVDPAESELIRQKVADIEAMKAQLKRLKDMMETVNLIEEHTANRPEPKAIGRSATVVEIPVQRERTSVSSSSNRSSYDRERTPTAGSQENDEFISARVRMLNDVTSDLRAQAISLQAERDRIRSLKDEIVRRKAEAAAAAQLGEDALKRNSLTPTPQQQRKAAEEQVERNLLKEEYEVKKKEFEQLCQRLQNEDNCTSTPTALRAGGTRHDIVSEADDEAEEEVNDSDFGTDGAAATAGKYYSGVTTSQSRHSSLNEAKNVAATATTAAAENRGKDSIDSSAAAVNTTHDTAASLEAASMQSGSSQSYSMPPPMQQLGNTTGWLPGPIPPPLPTSWNPHFYYGPSHPPAASFTPPHFSAIHGPIQHPPPPPSSTECICSASNSATTVGAVSATAPVSGAATSAAQLAADPMLLQQFVQTQQMLINSVCQCNQMLWHQQREIDALNNTIHILQDRLFSIAGPSTADLGFNIRAESVPPPSTLSGTLPINNNIYASIQNRSQSEQPLTFMPTPRGGSAAYANFQQQQQLQQQQHLFHQRQRSAMSAAGGGYNYAAETQHQNASSASTIYSTLNNAAPPPPPPQFNNEAPQSPMSGAPGPIFMHHHNNAIHQNNANLRTQNQHANNLQQQQHQHSNLAGSNTLNNQVPPGNRANNYWDNFRSYSRQNLLSTTSNKSNEDQNQLQQLDQQYQSQVSHTLSSLTQDQPPQQQQPQLYETRQINVATNDCNNLNYDSNSNNASSSNNNSASCNKYLRSLQRNRINQLQQQQQCQNVENMLPTTTNTRNIFQPNVPSRELLENLNWHNTDAVDNIYENYNITLNDMPGTYPAATTAVGTSAAVAAAASARNMNMNLNFGNNAQYQRNKVPAKPTCHGAVTLNRNISSLQQLPRQQQQQYQNQRYNLLQQTAPPPPPILPPSAATVARNSPLNRNRREREQDFLLCTVGMNDGFNYVCSPTGELVQRVGGLVDEFTDNIAAVDDDEDDTTSEEIKRNLLVNALKNDKFTTKFYESIKEDVFRRLESLLLEKETTEHSSQHSNGSSQQQQFLTQLFNDVGSAVAATASGVDPTRKLYLNAQLQKQQHHHQEELEEYEQTMSHLKLEIDADEYDNINAEETESNNADNDVATLGHTISNVTEYDVAANLESEEPEENENQVQNNVSEISASNSTINTNIEAQKTRSTTLCEHALMDLPKNMCNGTTKKRKNQRQRNNINTIDASMSGGACALLADAQLGGHINNNIVEVNQHCPDHELINYIIARIHNQTQANTMINDTLLVEIAKLTATAAQNCATLTDNLSSSMQHPQPITLSQNISPKKIYAKIKKLGIPRQRDQFLVWYQGYLETLFIVNNNNKHAINGKKQQQQNTRNKKIQQQLEITNDKITNSSSSNATHSKQLKLQNLPTTTTATNHNNNNILENVGNLEINDADLAEADQICSANTSSNNSTSLLSNEDLSADANVVSGKEQYIVELKEENNYDMNLNAANKTQQEHIKNEYEELENNENPDEEGAAAACNNLTEKQIILNESEANADADENEEEEEETSVVAVVTAMSGTGGVLEATNNFNINLQHLDALSSNSDENNTTRTQKEFVKRNSLA